MSETTRILLAMCQWDYNDRGRGTSFEYETFYQGLRDCPGIEVRFCNTATQGSARIKARRVAELKQRIESFQPHIVWSMFSSLKPVDRELFMRLKSRQDPVTVNWFADDSWRYDDFTVEARRLFNYAVTTDRPAYERCLADGHRSVIKSQWAASCLREPGEGARYAYDVSFCGQPHTDRRQMVEHLRRRGIDVAVFGYGWRRSYVARKWNSIRKNLRLPLPAFSMGRVGRDNMHRIMAGSKINLHFAKNSAGSFAIHARTFEVPGAGGFLLSEYAPGLEEYFEIGREIEVFRDADEMIDKVRFYLAHDRQRRAIARSGHKRVVREHTYAHRVRAILDTIHLHTRGTKGAAS